MSSSKHIFAVKLDTAQAVSSSSPNSLRIFVHPLSSFHSPSFFLTLLALTTISTIAFLKKRQQQANLTRRVTGHLPLVSACPGQFDPYTPLGQHRLPFPSPGSSPLSFSSPFQLPQLPNHLQRTSASRQQHQLNLISRMQQALRHEAEYFDEKKRLLRAIFNETLAQCADAYRSKNVPKGKFTTLSPILSKASNDVYFNIFL